MNLTIANISTVIEDTELQAAVAAIGRQVTEHFQPEWGIAADLVGTALSLQGGEAPIQGDPDAVIYLGDSSQDPTTGVSNALGYHFVNHANIPYGFVYLDICAEYGEVWTVTLSHEVLELLADPDASMTVTGPAPNGTPGNVYYDLEVADPTQGDSYAIDTIEVSNFVGRSYFRLSGGNVGTNYLDLELAPFGVRPGGYFQYEDSSGAHQIYGERVTERQIVAKKRLKNGRRNTRRVERLNSAIPRIEITLTGAVNGVRFDTDDQVNGTAVILAPPFTATLPCSPFPTPLDVLINAVDGTDWSLTVRDAATNQPCVLVNTHNDQKNTTLNGTTDGGYGNDLDIAVIGPAPSDGGQARS